jgi:hypothetical protein
MGSLLLSVVIVVNVCTVAMQKVCNEVFSQLQCDNM